MASRSHPPVTPTFDFEDALASSCGGPVAGVDEAGRGAWCGPVIAAAVILNKDDHPKGLADSKTLSEKKREALFEALQAVAVIGVGMADASEIDREGIAPSTMLAMKRAIEALPLRPHGALIDGLFAPALGAINTETLVKGDSRSLSIAAASIIAKVTRDRLMRELDLSHPGYGWSSNKGYGAKAHQEGLQSLGVTAHHRTSYAPIRKLLEETR